MRLLSVCIASYNRVNELKRCLESIDTKYEDKIEIVISEDRSPRRNQIASVVENYQRESRYKVIYNENEINLGYDRNLGKLIQIASGDYVLLMSDDDYFTAGCLDEVIEVLEEKHPGYAYTPFMITDTGVYKRLYNSLAEIQKGEENIWKHHDDAILFSGLIFKRDFVKQFNADEFLNLNYFQVYLFMESMLKTDGYYIKVPLIQCKGDGENGYGFSDSAIKKPELMDRKSVFSNMEFNKGLIKVIKIFDERNRTNTLYYFSKDYSLKSFYGMAKARKMGRKCLNEYWKRLNSLEIAVYPIAKFYYLALWLFGSHFCSVCMSIPRKLLIVYRQIRK